MAPQTDLTPLLWRTDGGPVVDPAEAMAHLTAADPALGEVIRRVGPPGLSPPDLRTPYHYLQRAIVYQQLSGGAASTIFGRFLTLYGGRVPPSPARLRATPVETLRTAGLSGAKAAALLDLARHATEGTIPATRDMARLSPAEIQERLCQVRGVGPWTVEMLLMFYLGHPDILPLGDLGIRKGFSRAFNRRNLPTALALSRRGVRWKPYRSIASWYLWRVLELPPP